MAKVYSFAARESMMHPKRRRLFISACKKIFIFGMVLVSVLFLKNSAEASSASISVQSRENTLTNGDTVYVLVTVSSMDDIYGFEGYFKYDNRYLKFISGGKLVHGNDDAFHIQDVEHTTGTNKIVYSIKFKARKAGSTSVELKKPYHVLGKDNVKMSVSYDGINMLIKEKEAKTVVNTPEPQTENEPSETEPSEKPVETPSPTEAPQMTPMELPHKKGDEIGSVDLKKLSVTGVELTPAFSRDIKRYSGTLGTSASFVDIKYKTADSLAVVKITGNDDLKNGKNVIKIIVKNGDNKKTYRITLNVRFLEGIDRADSNGVRVEKAGKKKYISGNITIEAGDVKDETLLPSGFQKITVSIDGKDIKGYAYEGRMDQGYFLIYGKNTKSFYIYDEEKEQLLPYEQVKNWYRSMGGQDFSELEQSEKKLESYQYMLGILGAFSGLMFLLSIFLILHRRHG